MNEKMPFDQFVKLCFQQVSGFEFVDWFFNGDQARASREMNVSIETIKDWVDNDEYEFQVIYHEFEDGKTVFDYVVKKQIKRVGAIGSEFSAKVGYVYAVSNGSVTKIGASTKPNDRAKCVARQLGFDSYEIFISNPSYNYKQIEKEAHELLQGKKRDNTIYQRECFSCSIEDAREAIESLNRDIPSGPRMTNKGIMNLTEKCFSGNGNSQGLNQDD